MDTYFFNDRINVRIEFKKFIYSLIDNKYKYLRLTQKDLYAIINSFSEKKLKSAIKLNKSITEIYINKDDLKDKIYLDQIFLDKYDIISKIIVWFLGYSKTLKVITIDNININTNSLKQIFEVLKFNTTLEKIEITSKTVLNDTLFLSDFLEKNNTLKVLSLHNIIFEDIYDLAQGISKNKSLIYLNLSNSSIRYIHFLSTALTINNTLTHLNLENVIIEEKSNLLTFIKSLEQNKGLIKINLSYNKLFDFDIYVLSKTIQVNNTLQYIDLSNNYINNINILLKALQNNNTLKIINLQNNNINIYKHLNKFKINNTVIYK